MQISPNKLSSEVRPAPWTDSGFILFQDHPWVRPFFYFYLWVLILGYPAAIAFAHAEKWNFLPNWFALWAPVADGLRDLLPVFKNFEEALATKGVGHRTEIIHHILAYEWIVSTVVLIALAITFSMLSASAWSRYASSMPRYRFVLGFIGALFSFGGCIFFMVIGFNFIRDGFLSDWYRSDLKLPMLGAFFGGAICTAAATAACGGALVTSWTSHTRNSG